MWMEVYLPIVMFSIMWSIVSSVKKIPIAVILPNNNEKWFSISRVKPAIDIALQSTTPHLDNDSVQLTVKYADSMCDSAEATNEAFQFYVRGEANVFFGPCCDYAAAPLARQVRYWNLPMLTAGAMAGDFGEFKHSKFPLLTRVGPDINSFAQFVFSVLQYHKWSKVKLLYQPFGQEGVIHGFCHFAAEGLHKAILKTNIEQDYFKFMETEEIIDRLNIELGNTYSGKSPTIDMHDCFHIRISRVV